MAGGIKFSPDGKRLAASNGAVVNVLDTTDGKVLLQLKGHTAYCIGVAFSPDSKWLASGAGITPPSCGMQARGVNF